MFPEFLTSHQTLVKTLIKPACFLTIVVPVRNEAQYLSKTLQSMAYQIDSNGHPLEPEIYEIIILANNCTDNSAKIAYDWQVRNPTLNIHTVEVNLPSENSNIGFVRRWLMNEAFCRLKKNDRNGGIILTTDGDTQVEPNWISANLEEIKSGADAVGGRILIDSDELGSIDEKAGNFYHLDNEYRLLTAEVEANFDSLAHDPFPKHHQHFNASFAVTTAAFERAGGIPDVQFLEDVAFYEALLRIDARFRHSPHVHVKTSARCIGQTQLGLSTQINEWSIMGKLNAVYLVESAQAIVERSRSCKMLRSLWQTKQTKSLSMIPENVEFLAGKLFISEISLAAALNNSKSFGIFYEKILQEQQKNGEWAQRNPLVEVETAILDLKIILDEFLDKDYAQRAVQSFSQTSMR